MDRAGAMVVGHPLARSNVPQSSPPLGRVEAVVSPGSVVAPGSGSTAKVVPVVEGEVAWVDPVSSLDSTRWPDDAQAATNRVEASSTSSRVRVIDRVTLGLTSPTCPRFPGRSGPGVGSRLSPRGSRSEPERLEHAGAQAGGEAAVDHERVAGDERRVLRGQEQRGAGDLRRAGRSGRACGGRGWCRGALAISGRSITSCSIGVSMKPGQMALARTPGPAVVDGQVLGQQHDAALRRVVGAAALGALDALDAGDVDDAAASPARPSVAGRAWPRGTCR